MKIVPCTKTVLPEKIKAILQKAKQKGIPHISLIDFLTAFFSDYQKQKLEPRLNIELYLFNLSKVVKPNGYIWTKTIGTFTLETRLEELFDRAHHAGKILSRYTGDPNQIVNWSRVNHISILKALGWTKHSKALLTEVGFNFEICHTYFRSYPFRDIFAELNNADVWYGDAPLFYKLLWDENWIELAAYCTYMQIKPEHMDSLW